MADDKKIFPDEFTEDLYPTNDDFLMLYDSQSGIVKSAKVGNLPSSGGGSSKVEHDDTLEGDGTADDPLGVDKDKFLLSVKHDDTLEGDGSNMFRLSVVDQGYLLEVEHSDQFLGDGTGDNLLRLNPATVDFGITEVEHDATLDGDGTEEDPLGVVTATTTSLGVVKPDGTSITINASGTITANTGSGGLTVVSHDDTLEGDGTSTSPLGVADDGFLKEVAHDNTLSGTGTEDDPLSVESGGELVHDDTLTGDGDTDSPLSVAIATVIQRGAVKPDGTSIVANAEGTISAVMYGLSISHDETLVGTGMSSDPLGVNTDEILAEVKHGTTLTGKGTEDTPLDVADGVFLKKVFHSERLEGDGTSAIPLDIDLVLGDTLTGDGKTATPLNVVKASVTQLGAVMPDGETIEIDSSTGMISAPTSVAHDESLDGDGSEDDPLSVVDPGWLTEVYHSSILTGAGTSASQLSVVIGDNTQYGVVKLDGSSIQSFNGLIRVNPTLYVYALNTIGTIQSEIKNLGESIVLTIEDSSDNQKTGLELLDSQLIVRTNSHSYSQFDFTVTESMLSIGSALSLFTINDVQSYTAEQLQNAVLPLSHIVRLGQTLSSSINLEWVPVPSVSYAGAGTNRNWIQNTPLGVKFIQTNPGGDILNTITIYAGDITTSVTQRDPLPGGGKSYITKDYAEATYMHKIGDSSHQELVEKVDMLLARIDAQDEEIKKLKLELSKKPKENNK